MFVFTPYVPTGSCVFQVPSSYRRYELHEQLMKRENELNKPILHTTEDEQNYYLLMEKRNMSSCCFDIRPFTSYEIQISDGSLMIKSEADSYTENLELPEDASNHFNYKLMDEGYTLLISIPKMKRLPFLTRPTCLEQSSNNSSSAFSLDGTPKNSKTPVAINVTKREPLASHDYDIKVNVYHGRKNGPEESRNKSDINNLVNSDNAKMQEPQNGNINIKNKSEIEPVGHKSESSNTINIPVTFSSSSDGQQDVEMAEEDDSLSEKAETDFSNDGITTNGDNSGIGNGGSTEKDKDNRSLLKNYETIKRKTVFEPDMIQKSHDNQEKMEDAVSKDNKPYNLNKEITQNVAVRRPRSPILENVVDEEFM
ncbi:hypothetical protein HII13_003152 [Brettanomyces bruxellensis]|nr:hypothetical protein HII13_003152 [Brettanomyces bruxellensis]